MSRFPRDTQGRELLPIETEAVALAFTVIDGSVRLLLIESENEKAWVLPRAPVTVRRGPKSSAALILSLYLDQPVVAAKLDVAARIRRDGRTMFTIISMMMCFPTLTWRKAEAELCCLAVVDRHGVAWLDGEHVALSPTESGIVAESYDRLRRLTNFVMFDFLNDNFTIREMQAVHQALSGLAERTSVFRKHVLAKYALELAGERAGPVGNVEKLYRIKRDASGRPLLKGQAEFVSGSTSKS